jgi:hypothetical protein
METSHEWREPRVSRPTAPDEYAFSRGKGPVLPWSHVVERLVSERNYWLATVRPDGRPHVTPLWGVWLNGALYFDGHPRTRWARNVAANPAASVHLESGDDVVILEGRVEDLVTEPELGARIVGAWMGKYYSFAPDPAGSGLFRLQPVRARAWSTPQLDDGTRWDFDV